MSSAFVRYPVNYIHSTKKCLHCAEVICHKNFWRPVWGNFPLKTYDSQKIFSRKRTNKCKWPLNVCSNIMSFGCHQQMPKTMQFCKYYSPNPGIDTVLLSPAVNISLIMNMMSVPYLTIWITQVQFVLLWKHADFPQIITSLHGSLWTIKVRVFKIFHQKSSENWRFIQI